MEILKAMKEDNVRLTPDGKISFILGLLRDYQYEMALDKLEEMVARNAAGIPAWVWDIFIYTLGNLGHIDEAFRVLQDRLHKGGDHVANVSPTVWYFLLDECSKALHYEGTEYIWTHLVETASLNPSDGTTLNVPPRRPRLHSPSPAASVPPRRPRPLPPTPARPPSSRPAAPAASEDHRPRRRRPLLPPPPSREIGRAHV